MNTASLRSPDRPNKPARILMVDDNCDGLAARKSILEELGYRTIVCTDPITALHEFSKGEFDLVITDFRMPAMDGRQLIEKIRRLNPTVPVVLISGFVDALGLTEENTGADAVVQKSANEVQQLVRAVARVLRKNIPRKPASRAKAIPAPKAKSKGVS